jgi:protein-histidine pros-kinase
VSIYLQCQQEEALKQLREQNERLASNLEDAATTAEQSSLYKNVVENAPTAILLVSEDGFVQNANIAAHELFGYEYAKMVGMPILKLIPERYRAEHLGHREEYVRNPARRPMGEHSKTLALRADGTEFLIQAALSATPTSNGVWVTCVVQEVVAAEKAERSHVMR